MNGLICMAESFMLPAVTDKESGSKIRQNKNHLSWVSAISL
jgi:hypothetical protein